MISEKTVKNIIGRRKKEIHKGDCGKILIAAGSEGMAGAAILAARSALRAGSGLVRTAIPRQLFPIVQVGVPEATCIERSLPLKNIADYDAVCVGPGLGEERESIEFVTELLKYCENPLVIDADGLNIIAHNELFSLLRQRSDSFPNMTVMTPHMGEAKRLLGEEYERIVKMSDRDAVNIDVQADISAACDKDGTLSQGVSDVAFEKQEATSGCGSQAEACRSSHCGSSTSAASLSQATRLAIAQALVKKTGAITVLKGAGTIVAAPNSEAYTNTTGNPGMATAGSGDVLSGIITSLAGQKRQIICTGEQLADAEDAEYKAETTERISPLEAAICGVYIHGLAGDLAAQQIGEYGLTAGDLPQYTAFAIKHILQHG